jgi:protein CpxP
MKSFLMPLLALTLTVGTAAAQSVPATTGVAQEGRRAHKQHSPEEMATRKSAQLTKKLGLNADQTAKVKQILLARGQEMQAFRSQAKTTANRDQMREQFKAGRAKYDAQLKQVLTADQFTKYTAFQAEHKKHGKGGHGKGDRTSKAKA